MKLRRARFKLLASVLLVGVFAGTGLLFMFRPSPSPLATVMLLPDGIPPEKLSLFERWVPLSPGWFWLWRLNESVFGRRKAVNLDTEIIGLADLSKAVTSGLSLNRRQYTDTNGLQVWILGDGELEALRRRLKETPGSEALGRPRVATAHGIEARLSMSRAISIDGTQRDVGVSAGFLPHVGRDAIDLCALLTQTIVVTNQADPAVRLPTTSFMSIRTNIAFAARIQIPKGSGVFLLDTRPTMTDQKCIGVIISAALTPPKK